MLHPGPVNLTLERLVPLAMLLVAAISVPVMLWSPAGLPRLGALRAQQETLGLEVERLEREIERLRYQAHSIKTSAGLARHPAPSGKKRSDTHEDP